MLRTKGVTKPRLSHLPKREVALFVCDIQDKFRKNIQAMDSVIHVSKTMVSLAGALRVPIVASEQYPKGLGSTVSELTEAWSAWAQRSGSTSVASAVSVVTDTQGGATDTEMFRLWSKTRFSMVTEEARAHLAALRTQAVLLVGLEAHVCVQQTCLDLLEAGVNVYVLADGVSSQRLYDREAAFGLMREAGATITTSESAMFELLADAKHPTFKTMSALTVLPRPDPKL